MENEIDWFFDKEFLKDVTKGHDNQFRRKYRNSSVIENKFKVIIGQSTTVPVC